MFATFYTLLSHIVVHPGGLFSVMCILQNINNSFFIVIANFVDSEVLHDSMSSAMPGVSPIGTIQKWSVKLTPGAGL